MKPGRATTIALAISALTFSGCGGAHRASSSVSDSSTLWKAASKLAADNGARLISAQAVRTTERAGTAFMAATSLDTGKIPARPVWLVMGQTNRPLDCECTVAPGHDGHADGRFFVVLLDVTTQQLVAGAALLTDQPDLSKLGTPVALAE